MIAKECPGCKTGKPRADFGTVKGKIAIYCRPCVAIRDRSPASRWSQSRSICKKLGLAWEISKELYAELISQPCAYCGGPPSETGRGLDRINPLKGYTPDNVLGCCGLCNDVRGAIFTVDEMKRIGKLIAEIQAERAANGYPRADRVFTRYSKGRQRGVPSVE
jgi:hypothetical protein